MIPTDPDWEKIPAGLIEFYEDPEKHPLTTPTGKLEFYSTGLAEHFPDDLERPPVPKWIARGRLPRGDARHRAGQEVSAAGHEQPPALGRPLPARRHHLVPGDRDLQGRGADGYQYQPLWINPVDAEDRGIRSGDVVTIFNERGVVLAGAYVTERVMPGAVGIDHGAKYDPIVPGRSTGAGPSTPSCPATPPPRTRRAWWSPGFLAEVEKTDLEALEAKYPDAFARECHTAAGPCLAGCSWREVPDGQGHDHRSRDL